VPWPSQRDGQHNEGHNFALPCPQRLAMLALRRRRDKRGVSTLRTTNDNFNTAAVGLRRALISRVENMP